MNLLRTTLLTLVMLASSTAAEAQDYKSFPGDMCVVVSSTGAATYWYAAIGNSSSTGTLRVDCPILNERSAVDLLDANLILIDRHPTANIECTYMTVTPVVGSGGLDIYTWTLSPTSGASTKAQERGVPQGGFFHYADSILYFSCSIPPAYNGAVSYIQMYEFNPLH